MGLNSPKKITFIISIVLAVLGIIGHFIAIPIISAIAFWLVVAGFVLLALGIVLKGL